jgi:cytochrome c oxidase assembly protein subunit 15
VAALTLTAHLLSRRKGYLRGRVRLSAPFGAVAPVSRGDDCRRHRLAGRAGRYALPGQFAGPGAGAGFFLSSGWLVRWRWTHPGIAFAASVFLIWLLVRAAQRKAHWDNRGLSALVLLLLAAVYTLGLLDVILLAPLWVQVAHLLAADTLWAALVVLTARLTLEPVKQGTKNRN